MIRRDTVLFSGWEEHLEYAREYIREMRFNKDEVRIVRQGEMILVKAKKEIDYEFSK